MHHNANNKNSMEKKAQLIELLRKVYCNDKGYIEASQDILILFDVVEPKGKLKCEKCGSVKLRNSLRNKRVYCLDCKHAKPAHPVQ